MALRIDQDHSRFKQIVRGKIKANLRKYVQKGEMIGKKGKDAISIPIPFIDIPENRKDDFRREIMNYIGALAVEGKSFNYRTNERLHKALELKLFEDQKDSIKLTSLVSNVVDRETQEKIDVVKQRLIKNFGYDEVSATDVLNFVASIFARGDVKD